MHGRVACAAALAFAAALPASASADEAVTELGRTTSIASYGGWAAWSAYDEATGTYALTLRDPRGDVQQAEVVQKPTPWDVQLGPDARGRIVDDTFVRVAWSTGRVEEVNAHRVLTGAHARAAGRSPLYVEQRGPEGCDGFAAVPCRLVAASADPFGGVVRPLTPELTFGYEGTPRRAQPLVFSGLLTRRTSAGGELLGGEGIGGVPMALYRRVGSNPERFEPTGLTTTTGADGRWRIVLPDPGENPFSTAVAATPGVRTWAGRGTVGSVQP